MNKLDKVLYNRSNDIKEDDLIGIDTDHKFNSFETLKEHLKEDRRKLLERKKIEKDDNFEGYIIKFFEIIEDNEKTGKYEMRIIIGDVLSGRIDIIDKGGEHE